MCAKHIALCCAILLLSACGGGSDSSSPSQPEPQSVKPTVRNDASSMYIDQSASFDVLTNDASKTGGTLKLVSVSQPANGEATIEGDTIVYTANQGFAGTDSISYTVEDADGNQASGVLTVTVKHLPPVAKSDNVKTVQNQSLTIAPIANDTTEGDLTLTLVSASEAENGQIAVEGDTIVYTPDDGFAGDDALTYVVSDSAGEQSTGAINITVENVEPVANDDSFTVRGDDPVTLDVIANDTDVEGETLSITSFANPEHGELSLEGNQLVFTPSANFKGIAEFTYTITDQHNSTSTATVTVIGEHVLQLSGALHNLPIAGVDVTVSVGTQSFTSVTDERGAFDILIAAEDTDAVVKLSSEHPLYGSPLRAYLGVFESLQQSATDSTFDDVLVTTVTTAESYLIEFANGQQIPKNRAEFEKSTGQISAHYLSKYIAALTMIPQQNSFVLPERFVSLDEFLQHPFAVAPEYYQWARNASDEYRTFFSSLFADTSLTRGLNVNDSVEIYDALKHVYDAPTETSKIDLNKNGKVEIHFHNSHFLATWSEASDTGTLEINFQADSPSLYIDDVCQPEFSTSEYFDFSKFEIRELVTSALGTVYIKAFNGTPNSAQGIHETGCYKDSDIDIVYETTIALPLIESISVTSGDKYFMSTGFRYTGPISVPTYSRGSEVSFSDDGTFTEKAASKDNQRDGIWTVTDNVLTLIYPDNVRVEYRSLAAPYQPGYMIMEIYVDGQFEYARNVQIVRQSELSPPADTDMESLSQIEFINAPFFDSGVENVFGFFFEEQSKGFMLMSNEGQTIPDNTFPFEYQREGDVYHVTYYVDTNGGYDNYVEYCDPNSQNCEIRRSREMEVISIVGDVATIKMNGESLINDNDRSIFPFGYIRKAKILR